VSIPSELFDVFRSPQWLWLLLALPPFMVWDAWRKWGTASVGRRVVSGLLRVIMLAAVVGALADPRWHRRDHRSCSRRRAQTGTGPGDDWGFHRCAFFMNGVDFLLLRVFHQAFSEARKSRH